MRRVVVTGMGAITPIGNDVETFWNGLKEKKLGFGPITYFDTTDYKAKLAAEVKDFEPKDYMDPKAARRMERFAQFAVCLLYTSSSVSGVMGNAGQANYCASKAGIIGLTKSVARELGSRGITSNAVAPGFIRTEDVYKRQIRDTASSS